MSLHSFFHRGDAPTPPARITIRRRLLGRGSRLRTASMAAGLLSLGLASVQPAHAATYLWKGVPGDWFSNPSNWTLNNLPAAYPGAGDDAKNLTNAAMTLGQTTTVNSFLSDGAFTLNGGQFSGNQANAASTLQVNNIFTLNGGTINNFTLNAGTPQSGQPAPSVLVNNVTFFGSVVNANLNLVANPAALVNFAGANTVNGAISLGTTSNGLEVQDGNATLTLGSAGSVTGFGSVFQGNGNATLINNGLINATGGTLALSMDSFSSSGTLEATGGGLLTLGSASTTNTGALTASGAGSVVSITRSFASGAGNLITASGGGQVQVNNAALTGTLNAASGTALIFSGSTGNSLTNMTINSGLDLSTNSSAFADFAGVNTVNGAITLGTTSNGLQVQDGNANLILGSTGHAASLTGFGSVFQGNSNAQLTNSATGTINANAAGKTLSLAIDNFNNAGTTEATNGGTLALKNSSTTNTGTLAATGGGVMTVTGTLNSSATSSINGVGGTIDINGAHLLGTFNGAGATALVFNSDITGNNFTNTAINVNLDLATNLNAFADFAGANTVTKAITLGTTSNGLQVQDGNANLILSSTASLTGFGNVFQGNGNAQLTNNGLINANSAGKALALSVDYFTNAGTAEATGGGLLTLGSASTTNTGALTASGAGSVVSITRSFASGAGNLITASGGGQVQVNNAALTGTLNAASGTALIFSGSTGNSLTNMTINSGLDLSTNSSAFADFAGVNTVNGAITLGTTFVPATGAGRLEVQDGNANLILTGSGSLTGFGSVFQGNGNATLINNGLINATGGTLALSMDSFSSSGTLEATGGGLLTLGSASTTNTGALTASGAGSVIGISNNFASGAGNLITASGGGQVQVNNAALTGTLNAASGTALIFNSGGPNYNNSLTNMTVNANLDFATNANAFANFAGVNTVNGAITLGTTSNGLQVQDGNANLILGSTGHAASLTGFGSVFQGNGNAQLTNSATGTINANAAGKALALSVDYFTNAGTAEATNGGLLTLGDYSTTNTGALTASGAGSVVSITRSFASGAGNLITASGGGQVQVNNAALTGTLNAASGTALIFNSGGPNYNNSLTNMTVNANLDFATNANAFANFAGVNTVNGAITLGTTSNGLQVQDGNANLIVGSTGSLTGFGNVSQGNGNATLTNGGTLTATGAGKTLTVGTDNFNNTGTAQATNGATLNVTSTNATNSGTVFAQVGGTANFTQGLTQTAGLTQVFGTLNASEAVNGGVLGGSGKIFGNVTNTGGTVESVNYATPAGTSSLAINGNFTQSSTGALDVFFGNNFHTLLTVTGQTTLGGTLGVFDLDSTPFTGAGSVGSKFTFLDYSNTLNATGSAGGFTQYFSNEIPDGNNSGKITGQNGFVYELLNDTANKQLDLQVVTAGSPVPEASTTVSFGLLLLLGLGGVVVAARRKKRA